MTWSFSLLYHVFEEKINAITWQMLSNWSLRNVVRKYLLLFNTQRSNLNRILLLLVSTYRFVQSCYCMECEKSGPIGFRFFSSHVIGQWRWQNKNEIRTGLRTHESWNVCVVDYIIHEPIIPFHLNHLLYTTLLVHIIRRYKITFLQWDYSSQIPLLFWPTLEIT